MTNSLNRDSMTADERLDEVAAILAAGFLRARCRRGYVPEMPPDSPDPPVATHAGPERAAGIPRN